MHRSCWEIQADPRRAELVVEQLGLSEERGVSTQEFQEQMKRMKRETPHWRGRTSPGIEESSLDAITWLQTDLIAFSQ